MKKLLSILFVFFSLAAIAQVPNKQFGNWYQNTAGKLPAWANGSDTQLVIYPTLIKFFKGAQLASFTTSSRPSAASCPRCVIYNSDSSKPQFSDESNWDNLSGGGGGGGGGISTIGALNGQPRDAKGLVISGASIYAQTVNGSFPGIWGTGIDTVGGKKLFNDSVGIGGTATRRFDVIGGNSRLQVWDNANVFTNGEFTTKGDGNVVSVDLSRIASGGLIKYSINAGAWFLSYDAGGGEVREAMAGGGFFRTWVNNSAEAMRISTGNALLIGTTSATGSEKLRVNGGVKLDLGSDATGDIFYRNSSGAFTRLGIGSTGQVLTVASGLPSWATGGSGGSNLIATNGIIAVNDSTIALGSQLNQNTNISGTALYSLTLDSTTNTTLRTSGSVLIAGIGGGANFSVNNTVLSVALNPSNITQIQSGFGFSGWDTKTSGTSATIANAVVNWLYNPTSLAATYTVTLPSSPSDGQLIKLHFGGTILSGATVVTTLTVAANSGQTLTQTTAPITAVGGTCIIYQYHGTLNTWFREQ